MSGIYIKDMEMPKERESFQITIKYNGLVFDTETGIQIAEAHEVPDHGRLGDLDAIIKKIAENMDAAKKADNYDWWNACTVAGDFVMDAPTIIPTDKERV